MKKLFVTLAILFNVFASYSQAPIFHWVKSINSVGKIGYYNDKTIAVDNSGNVYSAGYFLDTTDFDPGVGVTNLFPDICGITSNAFIQKLDPNGNLLWIIDIGDSTASAAISSIKLDAAGSVFVVGMFSGTIDFDPGPSVFNLTALGNSDMFILKLDATNNFVWAKCMSGTNENHMASLAIDFLGNIYCSGYFTGSTDFDPGSGVMNLTSATSGFMDAFILKLDPLGNLLWVKRVGGAMDEFGNSVAIDGSGNSYTTGSFHDQVDFDPGIGIFSLNSNTSFYSDMFVLKLDPSGNFVWAKNMGGALSEYTSSAAVDASGNVYTTGSFSGSADFDPGPTVYTLNSGTMFISKLDNSGNFVWAKAILASSNSISLDQNNHVYTTGSFVGVVDFDPGIAVVNVTGSNSVWQDLFILKLDSAGNFIWAQGMGGTSGLYGASIVVDANFNVYTNGKYEGTIDFNPSAAQFNLTGTMDLFVHKLNQQHSVGINEMDQEKRTRVFPNPMTDVLTIQSSNEINSVVIYNTLGENVFEKNFRVERTVQIDLSDLPCGVYFIKIENDHEIQVEKIIKR